LTLTVLGCGDPGRQLDSVGPTGIPDAPGTTSPSDATLEQLEGSRQDGRWVDLNGSFDEKFDSDLRREVPMLLEAAGDSTRMPEDPADRAQLAGSLLESAATAKAGESRDSIDQFSSIWAPEVVSEQVQQRLVQAETTLADPNFSGYSAYRFDVLNWVGSEVSGDEARVVLEGVQSYHTNPNEIAYPSDGNRWASEEPHQFDVSLRLTSEGWRIVSVDRYRLDGSTGK